MCVRNMRVREISKLSTCKNYHTCATLQPCLYASSHSIVAQTGSKKSLIYLPVFTGGVYLNLCCLFKISTQCPGVTGG